MMTTAPIPWLFRNLTDLRVRIYVPDRIIGIKKYDDTVSLSIEAHILSAEIVRLSDRQPARV